jgi:hypothetical protein
MQRLLGAPGADIAALTATTESFAALIGAVAALAAGIYTPKYRLPT